LTEEPTCACAARGIAQKNTAIQYQRDILAPAGEARVSQPYR
jgi:hypothetical protein